MTHQELMYASPEDQEFYLNCVEGLPSMSGANGDGLDKFGIPIPFHCGPHSLRCLRSIVEMVKPKSILEIGFNMGHSSSMWLNLFEGIVTSCDISMKDETIAGARVLRNRYPDRFFYFNRNRVSFSEEVRGHECDLIFIDGGHLYDDVKKDIELAINLNIQYLAFDDILEQFGPGVMSAIREYPQLELISEMGNIALYKNKTV